MLNKAYEERMNLEIRMKLMDIKVLCSKEKFRFQRKEIQHALKSGVSINSIQDAQYNLILIPD